MAKENKKDKAPKDETPEDKAPKDETPKEPKKDKLVKKRANLDPRVVAASKSLKRDKIEVLRKPGFSRAVLKAEDAEDLIARDQAVFIEFTDLPLS